MRVLVHYLLAGHQYNHSRKETVPHTDFLRANSLSFDCRIDEKKKLKVTERFFQNRCVENVIVISLSFFWF